MKQCRECSVDLVPEDFVYERETDDGLVLREDVSGYRCPSCDDQVLMGRDAERISRRWYELLRSRSPIGAVSTVATSAPAGQTVETRCREQARSAT